MSKSKTGVTARLPRAQIASNRTPREINRNLVFNLIRLRQPISRADLARVSGLQRSTVSLIVEQLIEGRWVIEGPTGRPPRGRRPTFLHVNSQRAVVALDIHPYRTTVAVADLGGKIVAQNLVDLPLDPNAAIKVIVSAIRKIIATNPDRSFDGIGISLPGRPDLHLQKLIFAPNLKWPIVSIKSRIEHATGLRVHIENVANACALSEVWFGDSDGLHDLVVVNVSEGIGTGIFANGQLLRGENGMAGEFGHVQVEEKGIQCACGNRGCWETTASNNAALRYYQKQAPRRPKIGFDALLKLAQEGDAAATHAVREMCTNLGHGMRIISTILAPAEIVVVGDITTVWHKFGSIVEAELQKGSIARVPKLRPAYEGSTARLRSAVALVLNSHSV